MIGGKETEVHPTCPKLKESQNIIADGYRSNCTVEPALKDHPIGHKNVVSQDMWSLVTGSISFNFSTVEIYT